MIGEEYQEIRDVVAELSDNELAPLAAQIDAEEKIPGNIKNLLAENGFMGVNVPEEYGGSGMDPVHFAVIAEEISRGCASTAVYLFAHNCLCIGPILNFGTEEQKKKYLPKLASGQDIGCFCLTEPDAGSDTASISTYAEDKGDYFELTGTKSFVTNGADATLAIVIAKTKKGGGPRGMTAFLVETNTPGFNVLKVEKKLGIRGSSTASIALDQVKVPKENILGGAGRGFMVALKSLDSGRIGVGAQAVGIGEAAFRYAKKYASERIQFGKPIAKLQAVQFMLADMSTKLAAARLMVMDASLKMKNGEDYAKAAAQAKLFASEAVMWITTKAIQVCGGNGYCREFPLERFFRDAKITEIYEGTSEIQRSVIANAELKGK